MSHVCDRLTAGKGEKGPRFVGWHLPLVDEVRVWEEIFVQGLNQHRASLWGPHLFAQCPEHN
jgi:hypothetical protein